MNKAPKKPTVILALVLMTSFFTPCNGIDCEDWIANTFCGYFWGVSDAFVAAVGANNITDGLLEIFINRDDEDSDYYNTESKKLIGGGTAYLVIASILMQRSVNCFKTIDNQPNIKGVIKTEKKHRY